MSLQPSINDQSNPDELALCDIDTFKTSRRECATPDSFKRITDSQMPRRTTSSQAQTTDSQHWLCNHVSEPLSCDTSNFVEWSQLLRRAYPLSDSENQKEQSIPKISHWTTIDTFEALQNCSRMRKARQLQANHETTRLSGLASCAISA